MSGCMFIDFHITSTRSDDMFSYPSEPTVSCYKTLVMLLQIICNTCPNHLFNRYK